MAAPVLAYENLGLIQGAGWLFRGLDVHIGPRDRLALIGRNGAGKTTFFKALAGIIDTDEAAARSSPARASYCSNRNPISRAARHCSLTSSAEMTRPSEIGRAHV